MSSKYTVCLWYEGGAVDVANFYAETFPNSAVGAIMRAPGDYSDGKQSDVLTVEFTGVGIPYSTYPATLPSRTMGGHHV